MITDVHITLIQDVPQRFGAQTYEIRMDQQVIGTFLHNREESLAVCLRRAATAAENWEFEKIRRKLEGQ